MKIKKLDDQPLVIHQKEATKFHIKQPKTVTISYVDQTVDIQYESTTIQNSRQKVEVEVIKKDSVTENPLDGGKYTLYADNDIKNYVGQVIVTKGTALQTVITKEDGSASYTLDLPSANGFYIMETQAPFAYVRNSSDKYSFYFNYLPETTPKATFTHTFSNDRTTAKIHIYKVDNETQKAVPQGDAKLEGAIYGLYARNDINHPDGATGILFKAGDIVTTFTTDANGKAEVKALYLGNYYIKEITPPEGYLLDEKEYDLACDYEGDLVGEIAKSVTSKEQVYKQPFQLIKVSDNGNDTEAQLLSGAGFEAYLKSSLSVKEDGSYDFTSANPIVIGNNEETILFADEKGYLKTCPIPYGTYVVIEKVTPHNMITIKPFEVKIVENNPTKAQTWRVFIDKEFKAKLRIVKKDGDTGKTVLIPNTEFRIFNVDTNKYVEMITTYPSKVVHKSFFTDEDGDLILPEALDLGNYRIEEVKAPFGYVVNEKYVEVKIDTNTFYEVDPDTYEAIISVDYEDEPVFGELTIEKKGEALEKFKGNLFADSFEKEFIYKESSLSGAKFEVYAAEDIYTSDKQCDINGNRIKYYSKGELVAKATTGKDGKVTISKLPLVKYKIIEVEAPYGHILNNEEQYVTFVYVDDKTPVIKESLKFINERQKLNLSVVKLDKEDNTPIAGALFGLYADEDIEDLNGKVIIKADTLLEKATSQSNGTIAFKKDYPFAKYYAKELKAPKGYVTSNLVIHFDAKYKGQDVKVANYSEDFFNAPTTYEFIKKDVVTGVELSGATLSVIDKDGNIIDTWTSKAGGNHVIKKLVVGETYILREDFAPYGYLKADDVIFTVKDTEKIQGIAMQDDVPTGSIIINKDGEFLKNASLIKGKWYDVIFDYFKTSLAGVTFEVYAREDIVSVDGSETIYYKADELVTTIKTNDRGIASANKLPLGKYYLVETKTLKGFVLDSTPVEADISYVDQDTKVVYAGMNITNARQKVQITVIKKDGETDTVLEGGIFGLFAKEDILDVDGNVILKADTQIERAVTGKDGKVTFVSDLPLGQYYIKELEAPKGYVKTDKRFDVDAIYVENEKVLIFKAEYKNYPTRIEISKTDITGEYELEGATLSIIDKDGKLIDSWISGSKPHVIQGIAIGKYILREEIAPYGYKIATDVEFEVKETTEIQQVSMKDELVKGRILIKKTDEFTKKEIAGVEFEIRDENNKVIETLVTDKNGQVESKDLYIASFKNGKYEKDIKYYVVESKAAQGYILDKTVHEVILKYDGKAPEIVKYKLNITNKPNEPELPRTGDDFNPWLFVGIGIVAIVLGIITFFWKKEESDL